MHKELGKRVDELALLDAFPAPEGSANLYYGLIRSGKTYGATSDIIDELKKGRVVYGTWPINLKKFDDRESLYFILRSLLMPWKKRFFYVDCPANYHYINADEGTVDGIKTFDPQRGYIRYLNELNHCSLYIDEAWRVIDSYKGTDFSMEGRNLILVTGHKFRTVNLIAQRPTSVHVTARGNMNRFYKFVKLSSWPWIRFARFEFQEMAGETVDETKDPISKKTYWAKKSIFAAYNSYFYGDRAPLHLSNFEAWDMRYLERFMLGGRFFKKIYAKFFMKRDDTLPPAGGIGPIERPADAPF